MLLSWRMETDKGYAELVALGEHSPGVGLGLTRERLEKAGRGRKQLSGEQRAQVLRDVIWWATFSLHTGGEDHSGAAFALLFVEERTRFMIPSRLRVWCMVRVSYHLQKGMGDTIWVSGAALEAAQEGYAFAELLGDREQMGRCAFLMASSLMRDRHFRDAWLWWTVARSQLTSPGWRMCSALLGCDMATEGPRFIDVSDLVQELEGAEFASSSPVFLAAREHSLGLVLQRQGDERQALEYFRRSFDMSVQLGQLRRAYLLLVEDLGPALERAEAWSELADALAVTAEVLERSDFDFWARGCAGQTVHHRLSLGVVRALYGAAA